MPLPSATLPRTLASPLPTQTTLGSEGATATEPVEEIVWLSKTGSQARPPLVERQTPPAAVAANQVEGSPGTPATRETRPPMAGPMRRYSRPRSGPLAFSSSESGGGPDAFSAAGLPAPSAGSVAASGGRSVDTGGGAGAAVAKSGATETRNVRTKATERRG